MDSPEYPWWIDFRRHRCQDRSPVSAQREEHKRFSAETTTPFVWGTVRWGSLIYPSKSLTPVLLYMQAPPVPLP